MRTRIELQDKTARELKRRYPAYATWDERIAQVMRDAEDAIDAERMRASLADTVPEDRLPMALARRMLAGESPLRIWREHRGFTATALAEQSGVARSYISAIENGKREPSARALKALAKTLNLRLDDLV